MKETKFARDREYLQRKNIFCLIFAGMWVKDKNKNKDN
jgi:hypothetical protein